ncbi:hypothetical protein CEXT_740341 [Caerostris extrusa]|uniref:Uncharacterized protein n=1 Tax=Caerostris extrusa TaxID=172846 RepID=A0AAV4SRL7_CAEEX|nr:hypothetical protein CEXT_740341 [Caerostris extrusa]
MPPGLQLQQRLIQVYTIKRSGHLALSAANRMPRGAHLASRRIAPNVEVAGLKTLPPPVPPHSTRNLTKRPPITHADHSCRKVEECLQFNSFCPL